MKYYRPQTKVCGKSCFFGHLHLSAEAPDLSTPVFLAGGEANVTLPAWDFLGLDAHEVAPDAICKGTPCVRKADFHHGLTVQIAVGISYLL